MKFAYIAAAAVLSFSAPSFAAETKVTTDVKPFQSVGTSHFSTVLGSLASGFYTFKLDYDLLGSTTFASLVADIVKTGSNKPIATVADMSTTDGSKTSGQFWLDAGNYSVAWTASSFGGRTGAALTATSVTAVPGPEAGAGVGALAMLGVAYWAKRRRDEKALAA